MDKIAKEVLSVARALVAKTLDREIRNWMRSQRREKYLDKYEGAMYTQLAEDTFNKFDIVPGSTEEELIFDFAVDVLDR